MQRKGLGKGKKSAGVRRAGREVRTRTVGLRETGSLSADYVRFCTFCRQLRQTDRAGMAGRPAGEVGYARNEPTSSLTVKVVTRTATHFTDASRYAGRT